MDYLLLFKSHADRIAALSRLGQIGLEGLRVSVVDANSKFARLYREMSLHIPESHGRHREIVDDGYRVVGFMDSLTLLSTISEVEAYFHDIVVGVLSNYPNKIGKQSWDARDVLLSESMDEFKTRMAVRYASEMMFKRPSDYKKDISLVLSADDDLFGREWNTFVEAKARRDLGVHSGWRINDVYRAKVRDVGLELPCEQVLSVDHDYMNNVRRSCIELMARMAHHCSEKFS